MKKSIIINPLLDSSCSFVNTIESVLRDQFFSVIEIWDTSDQDVLSFIERNYQNIEFDVSLSPLMNTTGYSLAANSSAALSYAKNRISLLTSIGVESISISSPHFLSSIGRIKQIDCFVEEIKEICDYAKMYNASICFELFDIAEDKKRILGKTREICDFYKKVNCSNLFLTWDLAHVCLNHEDYLWSLGQLLEHIKRVHLSNYSLNRNVWFFGDKHIPFDIIGDIGKNDILSILAFLKRKNDISIAFEVATNSRFDFLLDFKESYRYICELENSYIK